jgi:hypothetical protein
MKARIIIEYEPNWPSGMDRVAFYEREELRWATVLQNLDVGTAVAKFELIDEPLLPAGAAGT